MDPHHASQSTPQPAKPLPQDTEVDVWLMYHDNLPLPQQFSPSKLLSDDELARQKRFVTPELQYRFQCRREMLRRSLTLYRPDIRESEWIFTENLHGKPQIDPSLQTNELHFNLSHTNGLTVLAISSNPHCGIDIENTAVSRPTSYLDIADRFFTPAESVQIKQGSTAEQIQHFFDFWTLKEAYIKAVGKGLSLGLDRFQFCVKKDAPISIDFPAPAIDDASHWSFHQETLGEDMRLAIALQTAGQKIITPTLMHYPRDYPNAVNSA